MNDLLRSLLDLERIPVDAGPIRLAWTHALPGWLWVARENAVGWWLAGEGVRRYSGVPATFRNFRNLAERA